MSATTEPGDTCQSPEVDQNKLVRTRLKVYDEIKDETGKVQAYLVGANGLYYPRHKENMSWLPVPLINKLEPLTGTIFEFTIPYWLAAKKGLAIFDG